MQGGLWSGCIHARRSAPMVIREQTSSTASPPWRWPRAAYVHVPFCAHRCSYCDFAIAIGHDDLRDPYVDALIAEVATLGTPQPVDTLFLGGGTPSHLSALQLERLLAALLHWLPLRS